MTEPRWPTAASNLELAGMVETIDKRITSPAENGVMLEAARRLRKLDAENATLRAEREGLIRDVNQNGLIAAHLRGAFLRLRRAAESQDLLASCDVLTYVRNGLDGDTNGPSADEITPLRWVNPPPSDGGEIECLDGLLRSVKASLCTIHDRHYDEQDCDEDAAGDRTPNRDMHTVVDCNVAIGEIDRALGPIRSKPPHARGGVSTERGQRGNVDNCPHRPKCGCGYFCTAREALESLPGGSGPT